jgi:hypothetical protein
LSLIWLSVDNHLKRNLEVDLIKTTIVGPAYLSKRSLPYAADIFYHKKITYFLPTGFTPAELKSVAEFPNYCKSRSILFPDVIWEMCTLYFENNIEAFECANILEPLRKDHIVLANAIYNRDTRAINETKQFLSKYPQIYDMFLGTEENLNFAARELLGHVLFGIVVETSLDNAVKYLQKHIEKIDKFIFLIAAVIINRIKAFTSFENLVVYEHDWYPLIKEVEKCGNIESRKTINNQDMDSKNIEFLRFRLFEQILNPIFGLCDSKSKSEKIAKILKVKTKEIDSLKDRCEFMAREITLMPTQEENLKQKRLNELINQEITIPLSQLVEKPLKEVKELLRNFILDSTVIAAILEVLQNAQTSMLITATTAVALSSGIKYILNSSKKKTLPSELLLVGMKINRVKYEEVQNYLDQISIEQLTYLNE